MYKGMVGSNSTNNYNFNNNLNSERGLKNVNNVHNGEQLKKMMKNNNI
jgi:hypothetical protein